MFVIHKVDGSLVEDATEVNGMFSDHFKVIFAPYPLSNVVLATRDVCRNVVPLKVSIGDRDTLEKKMTWDNLHVALM